MSRRVGVSSTVEPPHHAAFTLMRPAGAVGVLSFVSLPAKDHAMAEQTSAPLFTLEDLFRPIDLPADLHRPVCERTHKRLLHALLVAEISLGHLRRSLEMMPRHDAFTDGLRGNFAQALDEAGRSYALFLETRDCCGEA